MPRLEHALLIAAVGLAGCNMLTGADQLTVGDDESSDDGSGSSGATPTSVGSGSGSGGSTGSGDSTGTGTTEPYGDATGVGITEVAFYQAVRSTVFENGAPTAPSVSIVAGRPAVVRVFVDVQGATGAPILAQLYVGDGDPIEQEVSGLTTSSDNDMGSTINFDVPGERITPGSTWRVELKEPTATSAGPNPAAKTTDGNLSARQSHALKVTLIPIMYGADGSNRMPDTSATQVERYRQLFMKLYPTTNVVVSVGSSLSWDSNVANDGSGWDTLLNAVSQERTSSPADFDEFYYGVFEPASSVSAYCGGGCVAGLGFIGEPNGEYSRAAIGLGFSGDVASWTAVHEVGHNHGRPHSPCGGVSGADGNFPYAGGAIGVQGMDILTHDLVPASYKDFMGYCDPTWISDYVYEEILDFVTATNTQATYVPPESQNLSWERISVGPNGSESWLEPLTMARPPMGGTTPVRVTDEDGSERDADGHFYRYDHLEGGVLFVPRSGQKRVSGLKANLQLSTAVRVLDTVR